MAEPKLISPMLDDFVVGGPYSDHHGVRCCPAMRKDNDKRYILKIISVPESQVQLDALLLTGAYKTPQDALTYFEAVAQDIISETDVLKKLSEMEGFLAYESCQIEPMTDTVGYDVYLLSPYKRSLERFFRKNTMTHLAAVNLGLDMCASLAVSRQAGYLYADLKPGNIFISEENEYRIGDIGFLRLDSLAFAALPNKYRSIYTAPELSDPLCAINQTIDIYAAGLILYQAYNGGVLPFGEQSPSETLPAPMYADYEMAEIILKACDPNPEARWQDPIQMGQALVSYMQRNGVNDTPIVPPPIVDLEEPEDEDTSGTDNAEEHAKTDSDYIDEGQYCIAECFDGNVSEADSPDLQENEDDLLNLAFLNEMAEDDTAPDEDTAPDVPYGDLSEDVFRILEHADNLIAHETPDPVVPPAPIDVPLPPPIVYTPKESPRKKTAEELTDATIVVTQLREEPVAQEEYFDEYEPLDKKKSKKFFVVLLILLLLAGLAYGGYVFYNEYYLQTVTSLTLDGSEDELRVRITTDADPSRLTIVCTDIHGNRKEAGVVNGVAVFEGLNSNALYTVTVEFNGLGKLIGDITDSYTTPVQTNIVSFTAVTGDEDGSVILSFTVEGLDADNWTVSYCTDDEPEKTEVFTGHMTTVHGLTVNKSYTFTLSSDSDLYIVGQDTIEYTATKLVNAESLAITACSGETLEVVWDAPADVTVGTWQVRCYNDIGYDKTITTEATAATFTGVDPSAAYTVEVTAEGMSSSSRCYMTGNSVTITDFTAKTAGANSLKVTWNTTGGQPQGNWLLMYTIDGSDEQRIVHSSTNSVLISPIVPAAQYEFTIQLEDGTTVFNGTGTGTTPVAAAFSGYLVNASNIKARMCIPPADSGWNYQELDGNAYTDTFKVGQKAGFVLRLNRKYNTSTNSICTMYVIRDAEGKLISCNHNTQTWTNMWYKYYCELNVPQLPETPGTYTIEIYFNGNTVHSQTFYVTE